MCHTLMKYNISTPCLSDPFPTKSIFVVAINIEKVQETLCIQVSFFQLAFLRNEADVLTLLVCVHPTTTSKPAVNSDLKNIPKEISSKMHVSSEERIVP